jgi:hypothetical protein
MDGADSRNDGAHEERGASTHSSIASLPLLHVIQTLLALLLRFAISSPPNNLPLAFAARGVLNRTLHLRV